MAWASLGTDEERALTYTRPTKTLAGFALRQCRVATLDNEIVDHPLRLCKRLGINPNRQPLSCGYSEGMNSAAAIGEQM